MYHVSTQGMINIHYCYYYQNKTNNYQKNKQTKTDTNSEEIYKKEEVDQKKTLRQLLKMLLSIKPTVNVDHVSAKITEQADSSR